MELLINLELLGIFMLETLGFINMSKTLGIVNSMSETLGIVNISETRRFEYIRN